MEMAHCIFTIFKPTNLKLWVLIENYITTNETSGFFDKLPISSGIELELGPFPCCTHYLYQLVKVISITTLPCAFVLGKIKLLGNRSRLNWKIQETFQNRMPIELNKDCPCFYFFIYISFKVNELWL
jgi:hypothetical protein